MKSIQSLSNPFFLDPQICSQIQCDYFNSEKSVEINGSIFNKALSVSSFEKAVFLKDTPQINQMLKVDLPSFSIHKKSPQSLAKINDFFLKPSNYSNSYVHNTVFLGNLYSLKDIFESVDTLYDFEPKHQMTCLHFALCKPKIAVIKYLIDKGFSPNAQNSYGQTPVHFAATLATKAPLLELLKNGGNLLVKDQFGVTPLDLLLHQTAQNDPLNVSRDEIISLLLVIASEICAHGSHLDSDVGQFCLTSQKYLIPLAGLSYLLSSKNFSLKATLLSYALYSLAQNFTLSRLLINGLITTKVCFSIFNSIKTIYQHGYKRPLSTLKKITARAPTDFLLLQGVLKKYTWSFIQDTVSDLSHFNEETFKDTNTYKDFADEASDFAQTSKSYYEQITSFINPWVEWVYS